MRSAPCPHAAPGRGSPCWSRPGCCDSAFASATGSDKPLTHDEQEYLTLGLNLAAGRGFSARAARRAVRGSRPRPSRARRCIPLFLAAVFRAHGSADRHASRRPCPARCRSRRPWSASSWSGWRRACPHARQGPTAALAAAWLAALYPPLVWCGRVRAQRGALRAPGRSRAPGSAGAIIDPRDRGRKPRDRHRALLAGVLAGLAALARSAALVFVPLLAAWLWSRSGAAASRSCSSSARRLSWRRGPCATSRLTAASIVVAADGGINFWAGNHPLRHRRRATWRPTPRIKTAHVAFRPRS